VRPIRTVIAEDEPLTRARIARLLAAESDVLVMASCADGPTALAAIHQHRPELLFLDVAMPGADGFEVLGALEWPPAPVLVFVTAFSEFAVRAFEAEAADYVLKPFDAARLSRAVARARRALDHREGRPAPSGAPAPERLPVRVGDRVRLLDVTDIDYLTAEGNYVEVHAAGRSYLVRETLTALEARLGGQDFRRIHRSTVVRLSRVKQLEPLFGGEYQVTLRDGTRLVAARRHRAALRAALGLHREP
jgi:two-component system, LytTR family, response regulator